MPVSHTLLLLIEIVIPLALILWLSIKRIRSQLELIIDIILTASIIGFVTVAGRWDIFSVYLKYFLIILYAIALFYRLRMFSELYIIPDGGTMDWLQIIVKIAFIGLLFVFNYQIYKAYQFNDPSISINKPFHKGRFYVIEGGSNYLMNRYSYDKSQKYAVDLVQLSGMGTNARHINPKYMSDYNIFGDTLYSPVDGQIVEVADSLKNNQSIKFKKAHPLGNFIAIKYADCILVLSNLQQNSSMVIPNMIVTSGQPLATIGFSGDFKEPVLHLFAVKSENVDSLKEKSGLPLLIDNSYPVKNTILKF